MMRYPLLPIGFTAMAIFAISAFTYTSFQIQQAFKVIESGGPLDQLLVVSIGLIGIRALFAVVDMINTVVREILASRMERDAREELYISLLGKSQTFHNRQRVGDLMAAATGDVSQLNLMISPGLSLIIEAATQLITPLIAIAALSPSLLPLPVIFVISLVWGLMRYSGQLGPVAGMLRGQYGQVSATLSEAIQGIEVVKATARERFEADRFRKVAARYRDLFVQEGEIQARYLPALFYGLLIGLAFGYAMWLRSMGTIDTATVVAFMSLISLFQFPTFISLFMFALVQFGLAGARRILAIINTETEMDENPDGESHQVRGELVFENVSFGYSGDSNILSDISFHANPGETIAIVGQTGSGKTTLTRLVNRTYDASNGRVFIDGVDVRRWNLDSLRSQISMIEQDIFLFSKTIAENIAFGARGDVSRERIEWAAKQAQAHDFIVSFPDGYDTVVGERGVTLSGGQRQRLAIARAFLTDPRILILDDSTSAIDSATEDQIQRAMREVLKGRTTLLITHRLAQIRWADRIVVVRRGRIEAQGSHKELMQSSESYRRIFARDDHK
ncbi:MAG: ABC transporter ATP-binding protein [Chloroflexi bacterium]|nr:ABC transporter ATP-binding protein [Chloroflexota bacterium]